MRRKPWGDQVVVVMGASTGIGRLTALDFAKAEGRIAHRLQGYDVYEAGRAIRRLLPSGERPMIGPFVLFDHFGPARFAPGEGVDIAAHAHAHLAALTYLFSGASFHADDLKQPAGRRGRSRGVDARRGRHRPLRADARRLARSRRCRPRDPGLGGPSGGGRNQPADVPAGAPWRAAEVAVGGALLRVFVGVRSPIETCSPILFAEARTAHDAAEIPLEPTNGTRGVFFGDGFGALDGSRVEAGTLVAMHDSDTPVLRLEPHTSALILGGASPGRRYLQGNFIASTEARLDATLRRYS